MNNPLLLSELIEQSPIGKHKTIDIRTNKKKNVVAIEFENANKELIEEILAIRNLGSYEVNCYLPVGEAAKKGVISPIDPKISIENIQKHLIVKDSDSKVILVERLKRRLPNNDWEDSLSVKVTFEGTELPKAVTIKHSYYRIRPYIPQPLQCYKCQRLGHTAPSCKNQLRCLLCGDQHDKSNCNYNQQTGDFKCANCKRNHKANSKQCQFYDAAQKIEKIRIGQNLTYLEAKSVFDNRESFRNRENTMYNNNAIPNYTRSNINMSYHNKVNKQERTSYRDIVARNQNYERPKVN